MNVNYKLKEIVLHGLDFPIAKYRNNKRICSQSNDAHFFKVKVIIPEQRDFLIIWGFRGRAPKRRGSTQRSASEGEDFPLLKKKSKDLLQFLQKVFTHRVILRHL